MLKYLVRTKRLTMNLVKKIHYDNVDLQEFDEKILWTPIQYTGKLYTIGITIYSDKFDSDNAGICLERSWNHNNGYLLDSPHFCKKVYQYLMKPATC